MNVTPPLMHLIESESKVCEGMEDLAREISRDHQSSTMDTNSTSALLFHHIPPTPLRDIIVQYSLPPSVASYGLSFDKKMPGRISARSYYEISARNKDTGESVHITQNVLQKIYHSIVKPGPIRYDAVVRAFAVHGNVFCIDFLLEDPSYDIIRSSVPYEPNICPTCRGFSQEGLDKCTDCFGMGVEVGLRGDDKTELRNHCVSARRKKEREIPDEEIRGTVYESHARIEYSLKSLFCAIHSGEHNKRVADYNGWERKIRSLSVMHL